MNEYLVIGKFFLLHNKIVEKMNKVDCDIAYVRYCAFAYLLQYIQDNKVSDLNNIPESVIITLANQASQCAKSKTKEFEDKVYNQSSMFIKSLEEELRKKRLID